MLLKRSPLKFVNVKLAFWAWFIWHIGSKVKGFLYVGYENINWPLTFEPYGSNKISPKCQFKNDKFKLRSLMECAPETGFMIRIELNNRSMKLINGKFCLKRQSLSQNTDGWRSNKIQSVGELIRLWSASDSCRSHSRLAGHPKIKF